MEAVALLLSVSVLIAAWLYTVKKLSTMHALLRHSLGVMVGLVAMFVAVVIFLFIGAITPPNKSPVAPEAQVESQTVQPDQ